MPFEPRLDFTDSLKKLTGVVRVGVARFLILPESMLGSNVRLPVATIPVPYSGVYLNLSDGVKI